MNNKIKRLVIYAIYHPDGKIYKYVTYMLEALDNVADFICVVSNCNIPSEEKYKLKRATVIYERDDSCYDYGGISFGINRLRETGELDNYDELIILNDSIFGPFFSLYNIFESMDANEDDADFWGITKRGFSDFDGGDYVYPEHLQLYFYVVRSRMFHSEEFIDYWNELKSDITGFRSGIINYEFSFTKHFEGLGYKSATYCSCERFVTTESNYNLSPYHYGMYNLIKDEQCPFLKRKLFTGEFVNKEYTDSSDLSRAVRFIDNYTDYDVDMIWDYVLREYDIGKLMEAKHFVVVEEGNGSDGQASIGIIEIGKKIFINKREKELSENKLLLVSAIDEEIMPYPLEESMCNNVRVNLNNDEAYLSKLCSLFDKDRRLGLLIPPMNTFGNVLYSFEQRWNNVSVLHRLVDKYKLTVPMSYDKSPTHQFQGFICRSEILDSNILNDILMDKTRTAFQLLPLIAQEKGYYTKVIMNKSYVPTYTHNLLYLSKALWREDTEDEPDASVSKLKDIIYYNKLKGFLEGQSNIYIYGAGGLASRAILLVERIANIAGVVVTDTNDNAKRIKGFEVHKWNELLAVANPCIIIAVGSKNSKFVRNFLEEKGFYNTFIYDE